jgi:hypothetical protein
MKTQTVNTIVKTIALGSILSASVLFATTANAANGTTNPMHVDSVATTKPEIKYVGVDTDELLSFNVKYNNPTGRKFSLLVLDENGENLFSAVYNDKKFVKSFKLPAFSVNNLTFLIQDAKGSYREVFNIDVNTRQVTDVVVSKN